MNVRGSRFSCFAAAIAATCRLPARRRSRELTCQAQADTHRAGEISSPIKGYPTDGQPVEVSVDQVVIAYPPEFADRAELLVHREPFGDTEGFERRAHGSCRDFG